MTEARDYNLLRWIKGGIDETLGEARHALEAHLDGHSEDDPISVCTARLHQVSGTLRMVQIAGAEMLAEEMEAVSRAMASGKVAKQEDAAEILMVGLVKLPDYLEQIQAGAADVPVGLLPLINDLRAVRDAPLLSEASLFGVDLDGLFREQEEGAEPNPELGALARRLRQRYHLGLLKLFTGPDPVQGLSQLEQVVAELGREAGTSVVQRLYQAAHGLMAACEVGAIETGSAVKQLFGRLDRQTKRIIGSGEGAVLADPPVELFRTVLFYVAKAETEDPRVTVVKDRFALDDRLAATAASGELSGLSQDLLDSVRGALNEDLTRIKDGLDLFMRGGGRGLDRLSALVQPILTVADTLGMVGQGGLRARLKRLADRVEAIASGSEEPTDEGLMDMAGELLFVESSLADLGARSEVPDVAPGIALADGEYRSLVRNALHEASTEMVKAKEAISSFLERPGDHELVQDVPGRFRSVAGALQIIGESESAGMMGALAGYLDERVLRGSAALDDDVQDALADVVTGVEFYMDALSHGDEGRGSLLEVARAGLDRLGLERPQPVEAVYQAETAATATDEDNVSLAGAEQASNVEMLSEGPPAQVDEAAPEAPSLAAGEEEIPPDLVEVGEARSKEAAETATVGEGEVVFPKVQAGNEGEIGPVEVTSDQPTEATLEIAEGAGELGGVMPSEPGKGFQSVDVTGEEQTRESESAAAPERDVDTEILEIFLEEAREELETIQGLLPRWLNDQSENEALTSFRRSFHTLKGSGRLVGAFTIGEYAWSVENLLNRVIEGSVAFTPEVGAMLEKTLEVLPKLIHAQETGEPHGVDVEALMDRAFDLAGANPLGPSASPRGSEPALRVEPEHAEESEAGGEAPIAEPESQGEVIGEAREGEPDAVEEQPAVVLDPVLAEIFEAESRTHLGALSRYVEQSRSSPYDPEIGDAVCRAYHTLHGSASMAEVEPVAGLSATMERYANELRALEQRATPEILSLIERSTTAIDQTLGAINRVGVSLPDWRGLISEVERAQDLLERPSRESAEQAEAERAEAERAEAERAEAERAEAERAEAERAEAERAEAERAASVFGDSILVEADEDLVEIFLEEARELMESMDAAMQQWAADPENKALIAGLQRTLHTLKGGARLAGVIAVGDLSHSFESLLTALDHERISTDHGIIELAQRVADRLVGQIEEVAGTGRVHEAADLLAELESAITGKPAVPPREAVPAQAETLAPEEEPSAESVDGEPGGAEVLEFPARRPVSGERRGVAEPAVEVPAPLGRARRAAQEQVRVRADLLDRLVDNAGEVSIYRSRLEEQSGALGFNLAELDQTVSRLRQQLRQLELETEAQILFRYERDKEQGVQYDEDFDPLEMDRFSTIQQLSRSLAETVNDLVSIRDIMEEANREGETLLLQQSRVTTDLQDGLLRTRMVPFSTLVPRLRRVVRQTCAQVGTKASLDVHGAEEEMDRGILERMIAPIEHILRNAVSHGVEQPSERLELGKDEMGRISLYLTREGNDAVLTISDDGRGLRLDAIRARAIELGLLTPNSKVSDDDLMQLILEHGFSTSDVLTQISGRGVGMDVVISEVKQLGGTVEIDSQLDRGSSFTIRLPLTLAITHALLVQLNEQVYAIPHTSVQGVVRATREDIEACYAQRQEGIEYAGHTYLVRYLGAILKTGNLVLSDQVRWVPLLLVRAGEHRVALQVDGLLGNRQIVVKSVGPQLSSVRWITGGTILGDGRVALILDVNALVRMGAMQAAEVPPQPGPEEIAAGVTVMVVDDSITVRKVTSRLLERHNMTVLTATDGVDAVAKLQEQVPDVMLLDIEMPRMDGYELARHMRNSPDLADVPIIMITSRTGEKHRARAFELGVDRYLGKPYQETDLLDNIYSLLAEKQT